MVQGHAEASLSERYARQCNHVHTYGPNIHIVGHIRPPPLQMPRQRKSSVAAAVRTLLQKGNSRQLGELDGCPR